MSELHGFRRGEETIHITHLPYHKKQVAEGIDNPLKVYIANGTPLQKGHGDLIDRDDLLADSYYIDDWSGNEVNIVDVMTVIMADAIIEADKESEDRI